MRIAIDYTPAIQQEAGIGRYTRDLIRAAVSLDSAHEFVLLGPYGAQPPSWLTGYPRVRWTTLPAPSRAMGALWHRLKFPAPAEWITGPVDLFHAPDYLAPPCRQARQVITVHDLSFLRHPEYADPALARFLSSTVPGAVRRAALVLADSEFTRSELLSLLNLPPSRVAVVYGGVGPEFHPPGDSDGTAAVARRYDLEAGYVLFVGRIEPRKNIGTLLKAYRLLVDQKDEAGTLVIAGGRGWLYEPIFRLADELRLAEHVRFLGHVPDPDLPALMSGASVFVFPSYYEGFGLPPLEAMACGTPVVAGDAGSLPEVLGDAALMVPPEDVGALAAAIRRAQTDKSLRDQLRARGLDRAARFTWDAAAKQLLDAYEQAAA